MAKSAPIGRPRSKPGPRSGAARQTAPSEAKAFQTLDIPAPDDLLPDADLPRNVRTVLDGLISEIRHLRASLQKAYQEIAHLENLADHDSLVPVFNRRAFTRELNRMISFGERYGTSQNVLYFDLNGMKEINDTHGHGAGDAALKLFARILVENVRQTDIVGRLGGDEFAVILVQTDERLARSKAEELTQIIHSRSLDWEGAAIPLRTACGVHSVRPGDTAMAALDAADEAMYRDKHKNKFEKGGDRRRRASPARERNDPARRRIA